MFDERHTRSSVNLYNKYTHTKKPSHIMYKFIQWNIKKTFWKQPERKITHYAQGMSRSNDDWLLIRTNECHKTVEHILKWLRERKKTKLEDTFDNILKNQSQYTFSD